MTRETILRSRLDMASHNLQCYSANWLMTEPKEGREAEHKEAAAEVEMLKSWLNEFHSTHSDSTIEFVGHISTVSYGCTYEKNPMANDIEFLVNTGTNYLDGDRRIFRVGHEVQDWFVVDKHRCGRFDTERDSRNSTILKITVDRINYIRSIEWILNEETE